MPPHILLAQFRSLLARAPAFETYSPTSSEHLVWLGEAYALVSSWRPAEAPSFKMASNFLGGHAMLRGGHIAEVLGTVHRAVGDLELQIHEPTQGAFGPGAMYDFFKAFNQVLTSAKQTLFVVDPYMDDRIFDAYFSSIRPPLTIRLLVRKHSAKVLPAITLFTSQYKVSTQARKSGELHDRVIFIDASECWVLGHSINDAARSKPTYLAPLSQEVALLKMADYERIWAAATAIS